MVTPLYISFVLGIVELEREIRDGLKCMGAVIIIILDRVPTCVGAALSQCPILNVSPLEHSSSRKQYHILAGGEGQLVISENASLQR